MEEIILDGLQLPNLAELSIKECGPLKRFMLSSMTKLKEASVNDCPKLDEIHIAGVLESLQKLDIRVCESFGRFVYVDIHWESSHESSLVLALGVFNKLRCLSLICNEILGIQVVGTSESLEDLELSGDHLQSLGGLSKLKNLQSLKIHSGPELRIVEGLDKLKFLKLLKLRGCSLLKSPIDVSTTELPSDCCLSINHCPKLFGVKQEFTGSVQSFKRYKEEEAALTDVSMFWHPSLVSHAESSTQEQMRVPGMMEELLAPFVEEESVPAALTDLSMFWHPSLVSHAESSAQEQLRIPGKMEELLAPFERSPGFLLLEDQREEEEDQDAGARAAALATGPAAAADPAELVGELELEQQHVAVEGGRGDVEVCSVHFQGQGGGDREDENGGPRLHPLPPGSDEGRDQTLGHYSQVNSKTAAKMTVATAEEQETGGGEADEASRRVWSGHHCSCPDTSSSFTAICFSLLHWQLAWLFVSDGIHVCVERNWS